MTLFDELKARGLVAQTNGEPEVAELINSGKATFYTGYDPTADSLTAGHAVMLAFMRRLQQAGNRPIIVLGGGTTMIGDPSGRTDMRKMLTPEQIAANGERFKSQIAKFIEFGDESSNSGGGTGKAIMVNNADWLGELSFFEYAREVAVHFSVNNMLRAEAYRSRFEIGLTLMELMYMTMQAYDFEQLFKRYGCTLQCGGDDQWSNILAGADLIRRKLRKDAHVLTIPLLLDSNGVKMGKTAGNAVWLDPAKTSPYEFYQYWRNVGDADVIKCLKVQTFVPLDEIAELANGNPNHAKERLAFELTKLVHSEEDAVKAQATARTVFGGGVSDDMPTVTLEAGEYSVAELLVASKLCESKGDARRNIEQGGVSVDGRIIKDVSETATVTAAGIILKRGKKRIARIRA
ncbi:MAG: tyrosine--tRNA ligase [Oscillospiraceae bacterium]|jgi:tyrosyl-tRNA synthetase|nr:tyrosine--tRNA ligase [Oscillospiraceae bacterium]